MSVEWLASSNCGCSITQGFLEDTEQQFVQNGIEQGCQIRFHHGPPQEFVCPLFAPLGSAWSGHHGQLGMIRSGVAGASLLLSLGQPHGPTLQPIVGLI